MTKPSLVVCQICGLRMEGDIRKIRFKVVAIKGKFEPVCEECFNNVNKSYSDRKDG